MSEGRRWLTFAVALLISAVLLYLSLRQANLAEVWAALASARLGLVVLAGCIGVTSNLLRAMRWGVLLDIRPPNKLRILYTSTMIGYLVSNVVPARLGELARIYVLDLKERVSMSTSLATVFVERISDSLALLLLTAVLVSFIPFPPGLSAAIRLASLGLLVVMLVLVVFALRGARISAGVGRLVGRVSQPAGLRLSGMLERFMTGLSALRRPRQGAQVLGFTSLIWAVEAVVVRLVIASLDIDLPWFAPLLILVVVSLSFLIPAAPGGVGVYEYFTLLALAPFAISQTEALSIALLLHALVFVSATLQGLVSLWLEGVSFRGMSAEIELAQRKGA